jgi:FMN phosphatase YigB (HAD superfamily)
MIAVRNVKACVFDAYGTLFDAHSAVGRCRERKKTPSACPRCGGRACESGNGRITAARLTRPTKSYLFGSTAIFRRVVSVRVSRVPMHG